MVGYKVTGDGDKPDDKGSSGLSVFVDCLPCFNESLLSNILDISLVRDPIFNVPVDLVNTTVVQGSEGCPVTFNCLLNQVVL